MSHSQRRGEGSGRPGKPENSQEVTFLRLQLRAAFKEVDARETREIYAATSVREYENEAHYSLMLSDVAWLDDESLLCLKVPDRFLEVAEVTLREFFNAIVAGKDVDPSWKKAIYKVICKLDSEVPEVFKSPNCLQELLHE